MIIWWKRKPAVVFSWITVFLWMAVIFALSDQPREQSNQLSQGIAEKIVEAVETVAPESDIGIEVFNHVVRKNAHFFAYLVLGIFTANALKQSGCTGRRMFWLTVVLCSAYAISDEVHQLFVPGRGGQVRDGLIDVAGGIAGAFLYGRLGRGPVGFRSKD